MYDLNTLVDPKDDLKNRVSLKGATDINNLGWITANGLDKVTGASHGYSLTPIAYKIAYQSPGTFSKWKAGQQVPIKVRLINFDGSPIADDRAQDLAATPCRVTFSASGAQSREATCMKYGAVANQFVYRWPLGITVFGPASIRVQIRYGSPSKTTTASSRTVTIVN